MPDDETVDCFNCGRANPEWAQVCRSCGVALRHGEERVVPTGIPRMDRFFRDQLVIIQHEHNRVGLAKLIDEICQDCLEFALTGWDIKLFARALESSNESADKTYRVIVIRVQ